MIEVSFGQLLEAAIDALNGFDDFVEDEVERFLMEVEDHDWVTART